MRPAVHELADDSGKIELDAVISPANWPDNGDWLYTVASDPPPPHTPSYNNGSADDSVDKHGRNLSKDKYDDQDVATHLDPIAIHGKAD
jgi:hypothetical protein